MGVGVSKTLSTLLTLIFTSLLGIAIPVSINYMLDFYYTKLNPGDHIKVVGGSYETIIFFNSSKTKTFLSGFMIEAGEYRSYLQINKILEPNEIYEDFFGMDPDVKMNMIGPILRYPNESSKNARKVFEDIFSLELKKPASKCVNSVLFPTSSGQLHFIFDTQSDETTNKEVAKFEYTGKIYFHPLYYGSSNTVMTKPVNYTVLIFSDQRCIEALHEKIS